MQFSSRQSQALAASIAAMMIIAPLAFQHVKPLRDAQPPPKTVAVVESQIKAVPPVPAAPPRGDTLNSHPAGIGGGASVPPGDDAAQRNAEAPKPEIDAKKKEKEDVSQVAQQPPAATPSVAPPAPEPRAADARREVDAKVAASPPASAPGTDAQSAAPQETGKIAIGKQSLGSDNGGLSTDVASAKAPAAAANSTSQPTDGLGAVGGYADHKKNRDRASIASLTPPSPAPAKAGDANVPALAMGRTQDQPVANADLGRRMVESDTYAARPELKKPMNPYAWMGHADEQRAIMLEENRDKFIAAEINPVKQVATEPVSTFSIDVDTASYSFVRRALNAGHLPPKDAVRVEEMINYFPYNYPAPETAETPFKPTLTVTPAPWNSNNQLVHIAIKGYDLKSAERPRANLVLLMDVSGSMAPADRLPLVKNAFRMLIDQLKPDDTVGIVTYASGSGIALAPTQVSDKGKILAAIENLHAGGSTAGAAGITDAYRLAEVGFDKSAVNRIILATDGDFNVGITDQNELKGYIERKRQSGIFLSILGVGQGNHNDALMQTLAQNGNGTAAYVDTLSEARKVLVDESSSTLFTIAKDVKVQIEWNPERVAEYRLIGYESRALKREDFNNDKVDAGDIGSGHTVTAIYEVTPVGGQVLSDDLRYGKKVAATDNVRREPASADAQSREKSGELGFLKLRYKRPNEDVSNLVSLPINDTLPKTSLAQAPADVRFSIAVAAFAQMLRGTPYTAGFSYDDILVLAQSARGDDPFGYRAEFLNLVRLAKSARP